MCGINGIITSNKINAVDVKTKLSLMNTEIIHRGPDQDGNFVETSNNAVCIGMAMRRLSIIDIKSGNQPIYSDNKQVVIVFNGEIYNYVFLRDKLIKLGVSFYTNSDTEVVLKLYENYGTAAFSMLDGMFAFSIYDKTVDKVYVARDFFGEKPLYFYQNQNTFIWASELKSIIKILPSKPNISKDGFNLFFQLTYIPAPFTIYENIHKLEANSYIEFNCNNFISTFHEIKHDFSADYTGINWVEAKNMTHDLVQKSILSRTISDVPLGAFLSGGVDSSIIALCLAKQANCKLDTFSMGFDKKTFDETDKSRLVAKLLNSNHHEFIIAEKDLIPCIDKILHNFDEPFADSSALASYMLALNTKQHVKVALTGDGGDEVFGGYNKYYMGKLNQTYTSYISPYFHNGLCYVSDNLLQLKDDDRGLKFKLDRFLKAIDYKGNYYYKIISLGFHENEIKSILKNNSYKENTMSYFKNKIENKNVTLTDFREIDRILSLEGDMLVKVDRTSMLSSLECRAPFLNKEIWNFTRQLPENYLLNGWDKKHILKESFKHYFPKDFLNKSKKGFEVPVGDWLRTNLKNELLSYIEIAFVEKQNIFQFEVVSNLVNNHVLGKIDNTFRVWTFYCFQKWYKQTYEK